MKILVGIIILALSATVVALGVSLGKVRAKYRVAKYILDKYSGKTF